MTAGRLRTRTFPVILSAPSGAGKTTIARALRERRPDVVFSVSATTRPPRGYERDGRDYHFVPEEEFLRMLDAGELVEHARVHGNWYGTPLRNLEEAVARDEFLLLDIDVQGARQIRSKFPGAVHVFVLPPSGVALAERLLGRGSESVEARARRMDAALEEVHQAAEFDYVVVNDDLQAAVAAVEGILAAESRRVSRIADLHEEMDRICGEIRAHLAAREGAEPPTAGAP